MALASTATLASAQDNYWTGGASFWDIASNWLLGAPSSDQRLFVGYSPYAFSGGTTFRSGSLSVKSLFSKNALTVSGGSLSLTSASEASSIDGSLAVSGGNLGGASSLSVAGVVTLTGGTLSGSGTVTANGGLSIAGTGTVRIADTKRLDNRGAMSWTGGTVNVDNGASFSNAAGATFGANAAATWTGGALLNAGSLTHSSSSTTVFAGLAVTNTGTIEATAGELRFSNPALWLNSGVVKASGTGKVVFQGGTYDLGGQNIQAEGNGTVTFSNAALGAYWGGWAIPASAPTGSIRLLNSTLNPAIVLGSSRLGFFGSNTLDGVMGDSGFSFLSGGVQTIKNAFSPGGAVALDFGARLAFTGDRTVDYPVLVQELGTNPSAGLRAAPGSTLTIGPSGSVTGGGGKIDADGSAFNFKNQGTLSASSVIVVDVAGGSLTNAGLIVGKSQDSAYGAGSVLSVGAGSFVNSGTVRGDGGGVNLTGEGTATFSNTGTMEAVNGGSVGVFKNFGAGDIAWSNAGLLRAHGVGSRLFLGGSFDLAGLGNFAVTNGATAVVYGNYNNAGHTLNVGYKDAWMLSTGGKISGGSILGSANLGFENIYTPSKLENVGLDAGLNVVTGQVTLLGTTKLNGDTVVDRGRLNFSGDVTLTHNLTVTSGAIGMTKVGGGIVVAPGAKLEGGFNVNGSFPQVSGFKLDNQGTVRGTAGSWIEGKITNSGTYEQTADRQVIYNYGGLNNSGVFRAIGPASFYIGGDGRIQNSGLLAALNGGEMNLDGYASGEVLTNAGEVRIDAGSKIVMRNGFGQTSTGLLSIGVGPFGAGAFQIGGNVSLGGTLGVLLQGGYQPTLGDEFTFMTYSGVRTGTFSGVGTPGWEVVYGSGKVSLRAVQAVPEPASMVALGLGSLALLRRRRKA